MNKRVPIAAKPSAAPRPADDWVAQRELPDVPEEETKRLTIDVSKSLHTAIKTECAQRGVKMADEIRHLLEGHFQQKETPTPSG